MLKNLTVSNLAVVEHAEAQFASGLTVLTGETGAGKSVLMGALGLVLGDRADATIVRDGAKEAEVEAVFEVEKQGGGGEERCRECVTIRRTVTREGRSRAWIDDESVSVAELKEFGRPLVDVHGPTANQCLLEESFQREALDDFAGDAARVKAYAAAYDEWAGLKARRAKAMEGGSEDELDLLRYQVDEIASAALAEDDETIAERHAAAAHAGEVIENANALTEALGGDGSAADILARVQPKFRAMGRFLPQAEAWEKRVEDVVCELQDLSRSIADVASGLDIGEESLDELDARLTLVNRLKRKYGATVAEILSTFETKRVRLDELEHRDERVAELDRSIAAAERTLRTAGDALTKARRAAAEKLSKAVTGELHDLGFTKARFAVAVERGEIASHGLDRVTYMFEPNPGESARPLAAIASSGEIARVMLALKVVLGTRTPTFVFDEIDANIGGEVGRIVGEKLRALARHGQVIAITHLPQSAAFGERHLVVAKRVVAGRTKTEISSVEGESRVSELARMLGGEKLTSVVRKHAEELLELSR